MCSLRHLHSAVVLQVAHAAQAAIVVHPTADTTGEEALGCPHFTDLTHLIIEDLWSNGAAKHLGVLSMAPWLGGSASLVCVGVQREQESKFLG